MIDITKEEYEERLKRRIDKVSKKVASRLLWTLISNSASDKELERREKAFNNLNTDTKSNINNNLINLCTFFDNPDNYKYNTFNIRQDLCRNNRENYKDIKELCNIADYLKHILEIL